MNPVGFAACMGGGHPRSPNRAFSLELVCSGLFFNSMAIGAGCVVAVGQHKICRSTDGLVWADVYVNGSHTFRDIVWTGAIFVAVGYSSLICTSPDGMTWTVGSFGTNIQCNRLIARPDGALVVVGGNILINSGGGWVIGIGYGGNGAFYDVVLAGDGDRLLALNSNQCWSSLDGMNWSPVSNTAGYFSSGGFARVGNTIYLTTGHYHPDVVTAFVSYDAGLTFSRIPEDGYFKKNKTMRKPVKIFENGVIFNSEYVVWSLPAGYPLSFSQSPPIGWNGVAASVDFLGLTLIAAATGIYVMR